MLRALLKSHLPGALAAELLALAWARAPEPAPVRRSERKKELNEISSD
jgi:hypothetical protein